LAKVFVSFFKKEMLYCPASTAMRVGPGSIRPSAELPRAGMVHANDPTAQRYRMRRHRIGANWQHLFVIARNRRRLEYVYRAREVIGASASMDNGYAK
jgi:hypothetical protein